VEFDLSDGNITYKVKLDNQCRIRLTQWFKRHPTIETSDEVIFSEEEGMIHIALSRNGERHSWSTRDLLGKETPKGKIVDIEHTPEGATAVVQRTERVPLEQLLEEL